MPESVGVQPGRVCPDCGKVDSVPLVYGLTGGQLFELAERGIVALGGCVMMPGPAAAFLCRSCGLEWGDESDPTAGEAELAGLLDVSFSDLVRALGTGWRREGLAVGSEDDTQWFVSGEPAQLAVGVLGPWLVLDRPLASWSDRHPSPLTVDGPRFTIDDVVHLPDVVAEAAEAIATRRRRSFRWCRTCRRPAAPESYVGSEGTCRWCLDTYSDLEE